MSLAKRSPVPDPMPIFLPKVCLKFGGEDIEHVIIGWELALVAAFRQVGLFLRARAVGRFDDASPSPFERRCESGPAANVCGAPPVDTSALSLWSLKRVGRVEAQ